jgi:hypothetical protein
MTRLLVRLSLATALTVPVCALPVRAQGAGGPQPDARFHSNVAEYMALRTRIAASLPPLPARPTWLQITSHAAALADGIRTARRDADARIFTGDLHPFFRELTEITLVEFGVDVRELLASFADEVAPGARKPRVNEKYDWGTAAMMPPCLLEAYPRLPAVLQYRFFGRDLLVIDVEAGLVVDILPRTIPAASPGGN